MVYLCSYLVAKSGGGALGFELVASLMYKMDDVHSVKNPLDWKLTPAVIPNTGQKTTGVCMCLCGVFTCIIAHSGVQTASATFILDGYLYLLSSYQNSSTFANFAAMVCQYAQSANFPADFLLGSCASWRPHYA